MTTPNPKSRREVKVMSDEELRVRVAELAGFKWFTFGDANILVLAKAFDGKPAGRPKYPEEYASFVPDYPRDLNAMHEAEKLLGAKENAYVDCLAALATHPNASRVTHWKATARQRAEAFVLTLTESNAQRGEE